MAAVSNNSAASEESDKELKKNEPEKVEILEPNKPDCGAASSVESEKKIEERKIEPPIAEVEIKTDEEPTAAEPEAVAAASTESGVKIEEKKTEPPVAEEVEIRTDEKPKVEETAEPSAQKVDEKQFQTPVIQEENITKDIPITEGAKETVLESETTNTECKSEDKKETGCAAEKEESRSDLVEGLPAAEVEIIVPDGLKVSKISESTPLVEETTLEQSGVTELTVEEHIVVDPVKDVEVETGIGKAEDSKLSVEEGAAKVETVVVEVLDQVEADTPEFKVLIKDVDYSPSGDVLEKTIEIKAEKIIEPAKNEVETAEKSVEADKYSAESEGETEKAAESEVISRDIELTQENKKKEETVASCETNTAAEVDDNAQKEATITKAEVKEVEKTPVTKTKSEEEKKEDETVKAYTQDSECTKDSEETQTSQHVPKEDVPVKTQKQSNNIIKMVKHSLGKAKKAIIGKSQNSKAPAALETKDVVTK